MSSSPGTNGTIRARIADPFVAENERMFDARGDTVSRRVHQALSMALRAAGRVRAYCPFLARHPGCCNACGLQISAATEPKQRLQFPLFSVQLRGIAKEFEASTKKPGNS
jgi:hypothetical protein